MIIVLTLLLGVVSAGLWQQVESFDESVRFFCMYHERQMLADCLLSYGTAIFCSDEQIRDSVYSRGERMMSFDSWHDSAYRAVLVMKHGTDGCDIHGELYKDGIRVCAGRMHVVHDVNKGEFLLANKNLFKRSDDKL
jgi:hypothetical protein